MTDSLEDQLKRNTFFGTEWKAMFRNYRDYDIGFYVYRKCYPLDELDLGICQIFLTDL